MMMIKHILKYALTVVLAGSLCASCITDSDDDAQPAKKLTVKFTLVARKTQAGGARGTVGDNHATELGTGRENEIDIDQRDYRILAFDPASGYLYEDLTNNGELALIQKVETSNGTEFHYTVSFQQLRTAFQLVVLANWNSFRTSPEADTYGTFEPLKTKLDEVMKRCYTLPTDQKNEMYIPMVGMQTYSVNPKDEAVLNSSKDKPYKLGSINMLRSVAKIEIIDKIRVLNPDASITGVSLSGYHSTGTYWPSIIGNNSDWNVNETQVVDPTLPDSPGWVDDNISFFEDEAFSEDGETSEYPRYTLYVSECAINNQYSPAVNITVSNPEGSTPASEEYSFSLNVYTQSLLRNHIYRYEIKSASSDVKINYMVCPWNREDGEISFD
ncbi:hypothetical protein [Phocaeicola sartorii]|uniref:hypothetical protein n=1 Tax=Phocaeicola sartorii TaxID=671267 RepID=UPI00258DE02F|nr:hypothetical protein [Phocaeicola sartorii]